MKLDRNVNDDGLGKYALLLLRRLADCREGTFGTLSPPVEDAVKVLERERILDWGRAGTESEFFLIRLKDRYAAPALRAYAAAAEADDPEWAAEVRNMAERAEASPWQQSPD